MLDHADKLQVEGVSYEIIDPDPVFRFSLPSLDTTASFTVTADHTLDETYATMIQNELGFSGEQDLLASWNETKKALAIGINSAYDGNETTFRLSLLPSKSLGGVSVPLQIPKCLAARAKELTLNGNYQILQEDPLIVWQFDEIDAPTEITFSVPKDVDEECKAQLRAMAFSQRIGKPLNPWLSLLLIPVIGFLLIFFQRFTPERAGETRLGKSEFTTLARGQGMNDEEIERQWREYKRPTTSTRYTGDMHGR